MSLKIVLLLLFSPLLVNASTCHFYPFNHNERWRKFLDDCWLSQSYDGNSYTLGVELPDTLEDYMHKRAECLNVPDIPTRHFEIMARLEEVRLPNAVWWKEKRIGLFQ